MTLKVKKSPKLIAKKSLQKIPDVHQEKSQNGLKTASR